MIDIGPNLMVVLGLAAIAFIVWVMMR